MARQRVEGWLTSREGARFYAGKWAEVLRGDTASIAAFLVERSELATELRQSSPFAGALGPRERWKIWRETRGALPARTMTRDQLEHLIRAAAVIADDDTIVVIGSQAVLGQFPDAPEPMRVSEEAVLFPLHHPERADLIEGADPGELLRRLGTVAVAPEVREKAHATIERVFRGGRS